MASDYLILFINLSLTVPLIFAALFPKGTIGENSLIQLMLSEWLHFIGFEATANNIQLYG